MRVSIVLVLVLIAYVSARYEERDYEQKGPGGVAWSRGEYDGKRGYRKKDYDGGKYEYKKGKKEQQEYQKPSYYKDDSDEDSDEVDSNEREGYQDIQYKKDWKEGKKYKKGKYDEENDSEKNSYKGGNSAAEKHYKKDKYEDDSSEYRNEGKKYKQVKYADDSREKGYKKEKYEGKKYYKEKKYKDDEYYNERDSYKNIKRNYKPRQYEDDSFEYSDRDSKEYDPRYSNEFDDAVYFSKRKLQYFEDHNEDDGFFDDVKTYHQQRENHVPNYKEVEYRKPQYEKKYYDDRRREFSGEKYYKERKHDGRKYYKERYYEIESPEAEREKYRQIQDEKVYRKYQPEERIEGGEKKYSWKQDRETWGELPPLVIPPPERPLKGFVPTAEKPEPPPVTEAAKMARYIVHNSDWTTVATFSTLPHIKNYPFVNVLSVSDGPVELGSGIPYLYMTERDMTPHDLAVDRRCSLSMSLAETDYCKDQKLDPEDPRCAHVTLTGEMWKLKNGTQAAKRAEEALFSRHPTMKHWPKDHDFFFATLKIEQIVLLDYFGGPKFVDVKDYLRANTTS